MYIPWRGNLVNLKYVFLRVVRHFLPENITRTLLRRGIMIRPGLETRDPKQAANRYAADLADHQDSLSGKRVLVFGYGGRYAIAVELLKLGAAHVTLTDLFAPPDDRRNDHLLPENSTYLQTINGQTIPRSEYITLIHGDIRENSKTFLGEKFDLVVSTSVYEHLDDVEGITAALSNLVIPEGIFIAYIDLRDHYFKKPFEMLKYSSLVWNKWLNPTSNLNRLRYLAYQKIIAQYFTICDWQILENDVSSFLVAKPEIKPEFLTGNDQIDSVTQVMVYAINPKQKAKSELPD